MSIPVSVREALRIKSDELGVHREKMGKRKSTAMKPKTSRVPKLDKEFDCPFCSHSKAVRVELWVWLLFTAFNIFIHTYMHAVVPFPYLAECLSLRNMCVCALSSATASAAWGP